MLDSISLENFKSFRAAKVPLGPFTLFVGTNASGKSNLRDAFRFLHGIGRGYALAEIIDEKWGEGGEPEWRGIRGGTREIAFTGEGRFRIGAELRGLRPGPFGKSGFPLRYTISVALDDPRTGPRVAEESLYFGQHMYFDSHPPKDRPKQPDGEHLKVRLRRTRDRGQHGPARTFLSSAPVLSQAVRKGVERLRIAETALSALHAMRFFDLSPEKMRLPSLPGQPILGDHGERLSSVLFTLCQDPAKKATLLEWLRALTPLDVVDLDFPQDYSGRVLVHLVEQGGRKVSAHSASDGTLRFLSLLAALLDGAPRAAGEGGRVYFIEELENGIHPTRLYLLLQLIEQQCRTGRVQVIATTHSPQILTFLSPASRKDAQLVYRRKGADDSRIRPIMELPEVSRILEAQDLGRLHASGWLEDIVELLADEKSEAAE